MLIVPPMISTPAASSSVPRIAFSSPPDCPVVSVVSTLKLKCGTALMMMPSVSQAVGTMTRASPMKQSTQNSAFPIRRCQGTAGHSNSLAGREPGGSTRAPCEPAMSKPPADRQRRAGHPADQETRKDVRPERDDHEHHGQFGEGADLEPARVPEGRV